MRSKKFWAVGLSLTLCMSGSLSSLASADAVSAGAAEAVIAEAEVTAQTLEESGMEAETGATADEAEAASVQAAETEINEPDAKNEMEQPAAASAEEGGDISGELSASEADVDDVLLEEQEAVDVAADTSEISGAAVEMDSDQEIFIDEVEVVEPQQYLEAMTLEELVQNAEDCIAYGNADSDIEVGDCGAEGDNVQYAWDKTNGLLVITGEGEMQDYSDTDLPPWIENSDISDSIETISVGEGVISIGEYAFSNNFTDSISPTENLEKVYLPNTLETIRDFAFMSCSQLVMIGSYYRDEDTGELMLSDDQLYEYTLPTSIGYIGRSAFYQCGSESDDAYINLYLPDSGSESGSDIGDDAFSCMDTLTYVQIGCNYMISSQAFLGDSELVGVYIGEGCILAKGVFADCAALECVEMGDQCWALGDIDEDDGIREWGIFEDCISLASIVLPATWGFYDGTDDTLVYQDQFYGCWNLESIEIDTGYDESDYMSVDGVVFSADGKVLVYYPEGKTGEKYSIPDTVEKVNAEAFFNQQNLLCLEIPNSVRELGDYSLSVCDAIIYLVVPDSVEVLGTDVFAVDYLSLPCNVSLEELENALPIDSENYVMQLWYEPDTDAEQFAYEYGEQFAYEYGESLDDPKERIVVTFDAAGGTVAASNYPKVVLPGDYYWTLPTPTRAGYEFTGWSLNPDGSVPVTENTTVKEKSSHTLYAQWTETAPVTPVNPNPAPGQGTAPSGAGTTGGAAPAVSSGKAAQTIAVSKEISRVFKQNKSFNLGVLAPGALSYTSSNKKVATVSGSGKVTMKKYGTTVITVTAAETAEYLAATVKVKVMLTPAKVKLSAVSSKSKSSLTMKWKKNKTVTGYEIQFSSDPNFAVTKTKTGTAPAKTLSTTVRGLTSGKTYYVRARGYRKDKGVKVYSEWSKVKKCRVK